jgi:membrane-associated phospholipid phosphatase
LTKLVKQWRGRGRPSAFLDDVQLHGEPPPGHEPGLGFPSGHTAVAFAMAVVVMPYLSIRWRVAVAVVAVVVAIARMYFGAHLPLDTLGGAALGVAIGACIHLFMDLVTHRH